MVFVRPMVSPLLRHDHVLGFASMRGIRHVDHIIFTPEARVWSLSC